MESTYNGRMKVYKNVNGKSVGPYRIVEVLRKATENIYKLALVGEDYDEEGYDSQGRPYAYATHGMLIFDGYVK